MQKIIEGVQKTDIERIDETVRDLAELAVAIQRTERMERSAVTLRLLLIARAIEVHGYDVTFKLLTETLSYTDFYAVQLIKLAQEVGENALMNAVTSGKPLTLAQWQALAEVGHESRNEVIDHVIEDDLPPVEITARATGLDTEEVIIARLLKRLNSLLVQIEKMNARQRAIDVLAEHGYVTKIIRNR